VAQVSVTDPGPRGNDWSVQYNANGQLAGATPSTAGQFLASNGASSAPSFQALGGIGAALAYSPSSGSIDPGTGIAGFLAAAGPSGTGRLLITLSAATIFAGLPVAADSQELYLTVVAGNYTLTLTAFGTTSGSQIMAPGTGLALQLYATAHLLYTAGSLNNWVLV
jgi:hypothetical protein